MPPLKRKHMSESEPPAVDVAKSELVDGFANILNTGKGSDLTITCNGATFKVHKAILASRSKFFETACWGDFAEAQSNSIDLPDDDVELVEKMLDYFYLLDYGSDKDTGLCVVEANKDMNPTAPVIFINGLTDKNRWDLLKIQRRFPQFRVRECLETLTENHYDCARALRSMKFKEPEQRTIMSTESVHGDSSNLPEVVPELATHASMYGIADKYGVQGLKSVSIQKLKAALRHNNWNLDYAQSYTSNMVEELAAAVQAAWTLTPESDKGIRALLLDNASKNKGILLAVEGFRNIIQQTPQFACDLLARA